MNPKLKELLKKAKKDKKSLTYNERLTLRVAHGISQAAMQSAITEYGRAVKKHHEQKTPESYHNLNDKRFRYHMMRI